MIMGFNSSLPFKVGQQAELKTFEEGFRGAWFRCKIRDVRSHDDQTDCLLEFFDFPDEEITWTKLYQDFPSGHTDTERESRMELMLRPPFPPFYRYSQLPSSYPESDVVAIVNDTWKVGDLVDWCFDGCYWSGAITQVLGDDQVKVKLPEPPVGEGTSYVAFSKDLRPSLSWSPEQGWTEPLMEFGKQQHCARLVRSFSQESVTMNVSSDDGREFIEESMPIHDGESNSPITSPRKGENNSPITSPRKGQCSYSQKLTGSRHASSVGDEDTIESSILGLEELANKIRWIKGFLQYGFRWSNDMKPSWVFLEDEGLQKK